MYDLWSAIKALEVFEAYRVLQNYWQEAGDLGFVLTLFKYQNV